MITVTGGSASYGEELKKSICSQSQFLSDGQKQAFLSCTIFTRMEMLPNAMLASSEYPLSPSSTGSRVGIFLEARRINYACDNNAQKNWNEKLRRHTVHAMRDIEAGEEITICYLGATTNRKARQDALKAKFDFICSCRLCSLPPQESLESDKRLDAIYRLDNLIGRGAMGGIWASRRRSLRYVDQQVRALRGARPWWMPNWLEPFSMPPRSPSPMAIWPEAAYSRRELYPGGVRAWAVTAPRQLSTNVWPEILRSTSCTGFP